MDIRDRASIGWSGSGLGSTIGNRMRDFAGSLRGLAREARAEVAMKAGDVRFEFGQAHVRRHVNSGQRKPQLRAESTADVHKGALEASLLRHLHFAVRHRRRIAKGIGQSPDWFFDSFLQQAVAVGNLLPRQFRTLQREDRELECAIQYSSLVPRDPANRSD